MAWIEYDEVLTEPQLYPEGAAKSPPFSFPVDECIPLTDYYALTGNKDYRFYAAIAGARRRDDDPSPLFPIRGVPPNLSGYTGEMISRFVDLGDPEISWLTFGEIERAIAHMGLTRDDLSTEVNIVLDFMQILERRFGQDRVRLIFYID